MSNVRRFQLMTVRTKAGDNERKFKALFEEKAPATPLTGKQRFKLPGIEISVDQSFEHDGREFLVEVDSGNMAKLLVGQYVLLNQLRILQKEAFFLVVHTYKKYNPMRTVNNLHLVNEKLLGGKGMPFGAIHIESLSSWSSGVPELLTMLKAPNPSIELTCPGKPGHAAHVKR